MNHLDDFNESYQTILNESYQMILNPRLMDDLHTNEAASYSTYKPEQL
jgi:hypothetical protein